MSDDPKERKALVLEDEPTREEVPPEPPPPVSQTLRRAAIGCVVIGGLFLVVFTVALGATWLLRVASEPEVPQGGTLAVIPFEVKGEDPELQAAAHRLTGEVTGALGRIQGLSVVSKDEAARFAGDTRGLQNIGQELGVRYLVDGQVKARGDELDVTVRLSNVESGYKVLSEDLTAHSSEIPKLTRAITEAVARGANVAP